jgi:sugar lactone lactonase YvrE
MKQLLIWALIILGTRTKIWESASQEEFLQGTAAGVAIAPEGVMMGPSLKEVVQLDDPYIWAMIQDDRGQLYLGTGDEGRLYQLKDGSLSLSFDSPGSQLTAIAVDRSHNLYAGSAPDGAVYKITPKGKVKEFFSSKERYTWGLAVDDKDNIYCATGELGRLYKLSPDGSAELIFEAPALHILSLIWANGLYFGSQAGVVYRRTGNDLRVLYEAVQTEIRALGLDDSSCLWFAANPEYEGEEPARPWLYRISPDGITEPIWSPPDSFVFALSPQANSVLVATGNKGRLYRVSGSREVVLLAQVEPAQITGICGKDPVWLSTANPARVYRVEEQYARRGSLTSRPLDAASTARRKAVHHMLEEENLD